MNRKFRFYIFAGVFILSLSLVFCAGYFRKDVSMESGMFNLHLSSVGGISKSKVAVYDIQNEGISKEHIQPGKLTISTEQGSVITNSSDKPIWLLIKVAGIKGNVKVLSANPNFDEKSVTCTKPLMPGELMDVYVNIDLPDEALNNYLISKGKIEFFDYKSNNKIGEVPLKIINSKHASSCCTTAY